MGVIVARSWLTRTVISTQSLVLLQRVGVVLGRVILPILRGQVFEGLTPCDHGVVDGVHGGSHRLHSSLLLALFADPAAVLTMTK